MTKHYVVPKAGALTDKEVGLKFAMPKAGALTEFPASAAVAPEIVVPLEQRSYRHDGRFL